MTNVVENTEAPVVSEFAGDPEMAELVDMFVAELPDRVRAIQQSLTRNDFDALVRLAHQLKGAAGGYGFSTITDAAKVVEEAGKTHRDVKKLTAHVQQLTRLCERAKATR